MGVRAGADGRVRGFGRVCRTLSVLGSAAASRLSSLRLVCDVASAGSVGATVAGLHTPMRCVEGCPREGPGLRVRAEWRDIMLCYIITASTMRPDSCEGWNRTNGTTHRKGFTFTRRSCVQYVVVPPVHTHSHTASPVTK